MKGKVTKTILLLTLLVLLIGIASATSVSKDITNYDNTEKVAQNAPKTVEKSSEEVVNKKIKDNNVKESSYTTSVSTYAELVNKVNEAKNSGYDEYTINLNKGNYNATNSMSYYSRKTMLNINGNGITLNGKNTYQFMTVQTESTVNINNAIFTNFYAQSGGVLYGESSYNRDEDSSSITVRNCKFINNSASYGSAIYTFPGYITDCKLTVQNCVFENNTANWGGAINNRANGAVISDSVFKNNTACDGGAIKNEGSDVVFNNNTFINNTAHNGNYGSGGAIYTTGENVRISKCVFANNKADNKKVRNIGGNSYLEQNNVFYKQITINNTNFKVNGNLLTITADLIDEEDNLVKVDTKLSVKIDNKSVITYQAVTKGKINTDTACPTVNGYHNIQLTIADSGNYIGTTLSTEFYVPKKIYATSTGSGNGLTYSQPASIKHALEIVENGDIINLIALKSDNYTQNITLSSSTLKKGAEKFSIIGENTKTITLKGKLIIDKSLNITLKNLVFDGQKSGISGTYIPKIELNNCTFKSTETLYVGSNSIINANNFIKCNDYYGGAIYNTGKNVKITNNYFNGNNATEGGAIYTYGDYTEITNNRFNSNTANKGGAIYNGGDHLKIMGNIFNRNKAEKGGAIYSYGEDITISNNNFTSNSATIGGAIYNEAYSKEVAETIHYSTPVYDMWGRRHEGSETTWTTRYYVSEDVNVTGNNFISNTAATSGTAIYNNGLKIDISKNKFQENEIKSGNYKTAIINQGKGNTIVNNINDTTTKYNNTIYNLANNTSITNNIFNDGKIKTRITVSQIKGVIGESIVLKASVLDEKGNKVNGGNLAFKLNGKTLRSDGRFDSSTSAMKFSVKDGLVTYTIKADLYLRNAKTLSASYSGTSKYNQSTSETVTAQIQKRNSQVTVTTTPSKAKQYETLTFKITAKDVTKNGKNNTLISDNTKVMLKVNRVTLKDKSGKTLYITLDKNAQATYKYTIPAGTGGITASKAQRNYKVDAIFVGENYYPGARNTTTFQVERSTTTVTITQTKVTKTNVLSVKATLKDYKGNNLIGTNKVTIKINGKSYTKNGKPVYWSVKNGNVDLTGIQVDSKTTIKRVLLVTGERQAYTEGRAETTSITRV